MIADIRSILSNPSVYQLFQRMMGADKFRRRFVSEFITPYSVNSVLDIGCGTADILAYLPNVAYYGFDIDRNYIDRAKREHGVKGTFYSRQLTVEDIENLPCIDLVLMMGVLHHLDNKTAVEVLQIAVKTLKPGGRLVAIDPCFEPEQHFVARFLVSKDRGLNVRDKRGYSILVEKLFQYSKVEIRHRSWVPYTHCIMECER